MAATITANAKRIAMISKVDGTVHAARNYKTKCTGKSRGFEIEYTDAAITCAECLGAEAQAAVQREVKATAAATGMQLPNTFVTATLNHELYILADGTPAPKCRKRPTKGEAIYRERGAVSCNSCTGAHLPGTHLG